MKKFHLLAILIFGFYLMPSVSFACGCHHSGKNSCNKETTTNTYKMDCCKNDKHSKNKNQDGCNGKCGHSNCVTTSSQFNLVTFEIKFKNNNFYLLEKKHNFFISKTNLSSGFSSIWLIPKIS